MALTYLLLRGLGIWGIRRPGDVGIRDHQFRLVDRDRPRGHVDLGDPAVAEARLANVDQPVCRGDDAVRGRLRGAFSAAAHGAAVAVLLADALPEHDGAVAAVAQPAGLGRVCRLDLCDGVAVVLVRRADPRPGDAAGPGASKFARFSTGFWRWAGADRRGTGTATGRRICCWRGWRRRWSSRCTRVVSFDFTVAIMPGWHSTIFPPFFVAGAIFSGFAMVMTLAIPLRKVVRSAGLHHHAAHGQHGQGDAGDRADRRLRLYDGIVHGVVQRQQHTSSS